ncbi:ADP-ribose pyrophosphatase YjhB (NUDIX family) [Rhizobium pisi]|uniref:ADP-ribose pyrophosphatase YjhB (NUDIX family) n=1 Tax=Rhizobium pisi TaxID=574561 RepID=A0A7W5G207_9HYPH|nr:NUDIX hydrolase N-terminal domain-containing protein [Rhizobium pisi]MBB3137330.1 ADP-ribose pyrophosphatase YjhB (NUDIX family) [Rhizobium pisi]
MVENQWLSRAKRLQAIASTGLHFCKDEFDRERYQEVADIAQAMLADLANVPIIRIKGLVSDFAKGYATPKVDVRGALIEDGKILLVQEKSDGLWTLPGGFADIGRSASENVIKETREEAGLTVSATHLYSISDTRQSNHTIRMRGTFTNCFSFANAEVRRLRRRAWKRVKLVSFRLISSRPCRADA